MGISLVGRVSTILGVFFLISLDMKISTHIYFSFKKNQLLFQLPGRVATTAMPYAWTSELLRWWKEWKTLLPSCGSHCHDWTSCECRVSKIDFPWMAAVFGADVKRHRNTYPVDISGQQTYRIPEGASPYQTFPGPYFHSLMITHLSHVATIGWRPNDWNQCIYIQRYICIYVDFLKMSNHHLVI